MNVLAECEISQKKKETVNLSLVYETENNKKTIWFTIQPILGIKLMSHIYIVIMIMVVTRYGN